jgi:hypothetical protein
VRLDESSLCPTMQLTRWYRKRPLACIGHKKSGCFYVVVLTKASLAASNALVSWELCLRYARLHRNGRLIARRTVEKPAEKHTRDGGETNRHGHQRGSEVGLCLVLDDVVRGKGAKTASEHAARAHQQSISAVLIEGQVRSRRRQRWLQCG